MKEKIMFIGCIVISTLTFIACLSFFGWTTIGLLAAFMVATSIGTTSFIITVSVLDDDKIDATTWMMIILINAVLTIPGIGIGLS